jgi:hypothetical protein
MHHADGRQALKRRSAVNERAETIAARSVEPSSEAGCAAPPLSIELQGEAGEVS